MRRQSTTCVGDLRLRQAARVHRIPVSAMTEARTRYGLSQAPTHAVRTRISRGICRSRTRAYSLGARESLRPLMIPTLPPQKLRIAAEAAHSVGMGDSHV